MVKTLAPNAGGGGLIPSQGTKIPHAMQCMAKIKKIFFLLKKEKKFLSISGSLYFFPTHFSRLAFS